MRARHQEDVPMEMHEIRYFLGVCETLSFRRAAERCHVTQPALTRAIQKLEAELGGLLFQRGRNQIQLTDFGRLMRPHLQEVLERTRSAQQVARSFLKLESASLTLGDVYHRAAAVRRLPQRIRARYPGIEVSLIESTPPRLSQLLLNGTLEACARKSAAAPPINSGRRGRSM